MLMRTPISGLVFLGGLLGACAHVTPTQDNAAVQTTAPSSLTTVPKLQQSPDGSEHSIAAPTKPVDTTQFQDTSPTKPAPPAPARVANLPKSSQPKPASSTSVKPAATAEAPAPAVSAPKPQLDFKAMEQRLRDTSAIGVFTKLSIKNQADDLLNAFRGYYAGHVPPTLDDLHGRFDGLLLKVVTLIQNDDATLASTISASRGAIWDKLSNKEAFLSL
jgi:hypothetical protein